VQYKWHFDKLETLPIHYLEVTLTTSSALLSPFLRQKLNPLLLHVVACKDIPFKTSPKFKPIFAEVDFIDG
jgi:hypothetical protein